MNYSIDADHRIKNPIADDERSENQLAAIRSAVASTDQQTVIFRPCGARDAQPSWPASLDALPRRMCSASRQVTGVVIVAVAIVGGVLAFTITVSIICNHSEYNRNLPEAR